MSTRPILFNTEMVRAILEGRKTVTRRVMKPHNSAKGKRCEYRQGDGLWADDTHIKDYSVSPCWIEKQIYTQKYAPCHPGDILYVRETWAALPDLFGEFPEYIYRADYSDEALKVDDGTEEVGSDFPACVKWRPSIHMPREAARIFLRVTDVRVERLQEITELQILEGEGAQVDFPQPKPSYMSLAYAETRLKPAVRKAFANLWDSTIKPKDRDLYGWGANPWVWVIEFERISKEEAINHGS